MPFLPWIPGWLKNQDPGSVSEINNPDNISEILETIFGVKILKIIYADSGWKNSDPGSWINIPDPQHSFFQGFQICIH
jgi:hypothetical protein